MMVVFFNVSLFIVASPSVSFPCTLLTGILQGMISLSEFPLWLTPRFLLWFVATLTQSSIVHLTALDLTPLTSLGKAPLPCLSSSSRAVALISGATCISPLLVLRGPVLMAL